MNEGKIYSLFIETKSVTFLSVQYATSLEEAFSQAKLEFVKTLDGLEANKKITSLAGAKIGLFTIKTVKDMMEESENFQKVIENVVAQSAQVEREVESVPIGPVAPQNDKNRLMKEIIETKDVGLYKLNRSQFSKQEQAYIRAQLKK